jgi:hypothetical protein
MVMTMMTVPAEGRWRIEQVDSPLATPPLRLSSSLDPFGTGGKRDWRRRMKEVEGEEGGEEDGRSAGVSCSHFSTEKISMASGGRVRRRE